MMMMMMMMMMMEQWACNLYVPIESKTPSQVLFNLFFIPTALPITIQ
jgi:hypothetical protein